MTTTTTKKKKSWDKSYADLVAYRKKHGHCNITLSDDKKYPKLGKWVH
jgi:hypothetical protein